MRSQLVLYCAGLALAGMPWQIGRAVSASGATAGGAQGSAVSPSAAAPVDAPCDFVYGCACCSPEPNICIPDLGSASAAVVIEDAPLNAQITAVHYHVRIRDSSFIYCETPSEQMYCSDILLQLSNQQHEFGEGYVIWDADPGETDGDLDDDTPDDRDIELVRTCAPFFEGDTINQVWYLDAWDELLDNQAEIDAFELWICYGLPADLRDDGEQWRSFAPEAVCPEDHLEVQCDIRNAGERPSGAFTVDFYASDDPEIDTGDYLLGTQPMESIDADGYATCHWSGQVPGDIPVGDFWIGWIIDAADDVPEGDETNNTAYKEGYQLTVKTGSEPPALATADPSAVCPGTCATLGVVGGTLGTGADWAWYSGGCGDSFLDFGAAVEVCPTETTAYYVRGEGDCNVTDCARVLLNVEPLVAWYPDADEDGYGRSGAAPEYACSAPAGKVANHADCDDWTAACHPGATELCDGMDNDCNGQIDEGDACGSPPTWYVDADADGYGDPAGAVAVWNQPSGYVANGNDCDDACADCHPGAAEVCDGKDNNCDGQIDEGRACEPGPLWYRDADGDGYGNPADFVQAAQQPDGYVPNAGDCDDTEAGVNPGQVIDCANGKDDDCDGFVDEDEELDPACHTQPSTDDLDGDGVPDDQDNCPETSNPEQSDRDGDGVGDACDTPGCGANLCGGGALPILPLMLLSICAMKVGLARRARRRE
jgi:hypothetical protein